MRKALATLLALTFLAGCSAPDLDDPRARSLLALPGPQHYAERVVARELAGRCNSFTYDEELAEAMSRARIKAGQPTSVQVRGATDLEAGIKRRSLAARYGGDYSGLNPCAVLDGETAQQTPLSVLVKRRG